MPGLFIQRHAEAVATHCRVGVVYTHLVDEPSEKKYEMDLSLVSGIPTARIYYHNPAYRIPLISPLIKSIRFFKANRIGIRAIRDELEGIDLIHVNILTRLGVIALWYKIFKNIPYVVSEHWSRYLPLTGNFKGFFRKRITKWVVKKAAAVTTVTQNLANAMKEHGLKNDSYVVLPNVVDSKFLTADRTRKRKDKTCFVHVSCFEDKSKNISGLLRVIKSLALERNDFIFKLIGDGIDFEPIKKYSEGLGLDHYRVIFTGLLEGKKLVNEMAGADLLVMFSNYENFPVVINESFVLGIPVAATGVGGIPEFVDKRNGMLVEAGDEKALENVLRSFLNRKYNFNRKLIKKAATEAYSSETVGSQLFEIYKKAVNKE